MKELVDVGDDDNNNDWYAALSKKPRVVSLVGKAIGDDGIRRMIETGVVLQDRMIDTLDLFGCSLTDTGAIALAHALPHSTSIRKLNLGGNNRITSAGAKALATALLPAHHTRTPRLEWLSLAGNAIGTEGAQALSQALVQNDTLLELHLAGNDIDAAGCCALAQGLAAAGTTTRLRELNLCANRVGTAGALALAEALQVNKSLQRLDLCYNGIRDEGACALARALGTNRSLRKLILMSNPIGSEGKHRLEQSRQYNPARVAQNLLLHPHHREGLSMVQVLQWMDHNTTLETLSF